MQIHGFNKTTLLDYPKHLAATIFTGACNFRCPFCQNASLVLHPSTEPIIPTEEVLAYLRKRVGILEGVCITGGEPTLQPDLAEFLQQIRDLGLLIKLDTNGYHPDVIQHLLDRQLLDYIAMDIKSSLPHYPAASGLSTPDLSLIQTSVSLIMHSGIPYEFRTTAVRELTTPEDFLSIGAWLQGAQSYFLQGYQDSGDLIAPSGLTAYTRPELEAIRTSLLPYITEVGIRGID